MSQTPQDLPWRTPNAESFYTTSKRRNCKSVLLGHGTYFVTCVLKACSIRLTCTSLKATENKHVHGMNCEKRHALQHSSFAAPPGSCDLQPVRATTPCALSWKKRGQKTRKSPTRQGGVVHPVLCCVWSAALLWHCWHTWYSTNLCEFANVEQVLVRWSLVPSGVAKKRVGAPPACSRSARVVCEGLARAQGRRCCPCLSADERTLKAPLQELPHCNETDTNADDGHCEHQICIE